MAAKKAGAAIAIAAIVLVTAWFLDDVSVGAQDDRPTGTIQLDVRYPDGSLVDDTPVCIAGYGASAASQETPFFLGSAAAPISPTASFEVPANEGLAFLIHPCQGLNHGFAGTWHFGQAREAGNFGYRPDLRAHAVYVAPNKTKVLPFTVGGAQLSGSATGDGFQRCTVTAFGTSTWKGGIATTVGLLVVDDNERDFTLTLEPGEYQIRLDCTGPRLQTTWPASGDTITVRHGDVITAVDFAVAGQGSDEGGFVYVTPDEPDTDVPYCLDVMGTDGSTIRAGSPAEGRTAVWVQKDDPVKLRARDCLGLGFGDKWYPNATSAPSAETITVDGTEFDVFLPITTDLASDDLLTCNGMEPSVVGTGGPNTFVGGPETEVILGFDGNDTIMGLGGDDVVCAGAGDDLVFGNAGADWIDGGPGADVLRAGWGEDVVFGGPGNDFIRGFRHDDTIDGGDGNDKITGGWGNDVLRGGRGNDTLRAYFGADRLYGEAGNDALVAGNGPDLLVGGWGPADRLFGDQGRDTCVDGGAQTQFSGCLTINGDPVG